VFKLFAKTSLLMLLCVALLLMRSGAHLHLCFDGSEPPVAVHVDDYGQHHTDVGADAVHQDADVLLAGSAMTRSGNTAVDIVPVFLVVALLLWIFSQTFNRFGLVSRRVVVHLLPKYSSPPLRGPPLPFFC